MLRALLYPFSLIYSSVAWLRNRLYDQHVLKSTTPAIQTVVVGNLTVGGTGKSPHIEYLIRLLQSDYNIVVLSRGYGRKTKGFLWAEANSGPEDIGDEPMQIHQKFDNIRVAVCEDRIRGIEIIQKDHPACNLVLLDDAFQHRKLQSKINILLSSYYQPYYADTFLPHGRLRDNKREKSRAQAIVISKSPKMLDDQERINIIKKVDAGNDQRVFFSSIRYETPIDLVGNKLESRGKICLITGIADPSPLTNHLASSDFEVLNHFKFADHHNFSKNDLLNISENMTKLAQDGMVLLTTEKDFVKLNSINQGLKSPLPLYYIPITMEFHSTGVSSFDEYMIKTLKNA